MEKNELPLISVLMTAYNREKYIAEAIESVLKSTYPNFELIIVDDCSSDKTFSIANSYKRKDNRVKVYRNEANLKDYPNRNKAASYANGKLLMYVDSDDSIQPNSLEYIARQFEIHRNIKFSLLYYHKDITEPKVVTLKESIRSHFFKKGFLNIGPGGTVIDNSFFKAIGGFPEKYGPANDLYYNLKAASNTDVLLLPYIYLNYRIHDGQEANNKYSYLFNNHRYLVGALQIPELPLTKDEKEIILKRYSKRNFVQIVRFFIVSMKFRKAMNAYNLSGIRLKNLF